MTKHATKEFLAIPFTVKDFKEKSDASGSYGYFKGYAAAFGNLDRENDIIAQGAFAKCLASGKKVKMCWQHDMRTPIGSFTEMEEDDKGLFVSGRINLGTEKGKEAYALLKAGDLESMSIGYSVKTYEFDRESGIRTLKELDLWEISIVTEPANPKAQVTSVKAMVEESETLAEVEEILKEKGFSNSEARALVARVKFLSSPRDAENPGGKSNPQCDVEDVAVSDINEMFVSAIKNVQKEFSTTL